MGGASGVYRNIEWTDEEMDSLTALIDTLITEARKAGEAMAGMRLAGDSVSKSTVGVTESAVYRALNVAYWYVEQVGKRDGGDAALKIGGQIIAEFTNRMSEAIKGQDAEVDDAARMG